jgi:hypothetical protein
MFIVRSLQRLSIHYRVAHHGVNMEMMVETMTLTNIMISSRNHHIYIVSIKQDIGSEYGGVHL